MDTCIIMQSFRVWFCSVCGDATPKTLGGPVLPTIPVAHCMSKDADITADIGSWPLIIGVPFVPI
jgi:hypothetical protein